MQPYFFFPVCKIDFNSLNVRIEYRSRTNKNMQALARADIRHFAVLHPRDWSVAYDNLVFRLSQRGTLVK